MYLSFRRSQDALLALGFFVLTVVVVFSTLLYVLPFFPLLRLTCYIQILHRAWHLGRYACDFHQLRR